MPTFSYSEFRVLEEWSYYMLEHAHEFKFAEEIVVLCHWALTLNWTAVSNSYQTWFSRR